MKKTRYVKPLACSGQWAKTLAALGFLFLSLLGSSASAQTAPNIDNIAVASTSGTYGAGEEILVLVGFSEAVDVNTSNGSPTVGLEIGTLTAQAQWIQQPVSTHLFFRYIVQPDNRDIDGIGIPANSLSLNGATIRRSNSMVNADLNHASVRHPDILVFALTDRKILEILYNAMGGNSWTNNRNWLSNEPLGDWYKIRTNPAGQVTVIELNDNNLSGEIPPELGNLANLYTLDLHRNNLNGEIPSELGSLANLRHLFLHNNNLSGEIPSELGSLPHLQVFDLSSNDLSGEIPPELGGLATVLILGLFGNNLSGEIPPELGGLAKLQYLDLNGNNLSGEIPPELGGLANLQVLRLQDNNLSGEIPTQLRNLANVRHLLLNNNNLSGEIPPPELGNLANVHILNLNGNNLSGEIPPELGGLANVQILDLNSNNLSGEIPTELGNLSELQELLLNNNNLSGEIPTQLGSLGKLLLLYLYGNNLSGEIPSELGNLSELQYLLLNNNNLSGEIPTQLGSLGKLQRLYLYRNNLSGEIPPELGNLSELQNLLLNNNNLSGEIPSELGSLGKLLLLYLYRNNLSGEIPSELGNLGELQRLYLSSNNLSGEIPTQLGNLGELQHLYLDRNNLSGEIPSELGSLAKLLLLDLSSNNLSGEIPSELGSLAKLWDLHLNGNELSGEIPTQIVTLPSLESLQLDNNMLSGAIPLAELETLTVTTRNFLQLSLWGNDGLTGAESISNELGKRVDRAALWKLHNENGGARWDSNEGWLPFFGTNVLSFGDWYGVDVNNDGRVSELNLNNNNLAGPITDALEQLEHLEVLNLADNPMLSGTLPEGLAGSALTELNIRCTDINTPDTQAFNDWLMGVNFTGAECSAPPPRTCPPGQVGTPPNCSAPPPPDTGQPPEQVMGVGVMEGVEQLLVSWDPVSEADGYKIQWKSGSQQFDSSRQHITDASTTSYTISNLDAEREYMVRVIATKSGTDDGMPSREVPGTPRAADTTSPPQQPTTTGQGSGGCSIASNAGPGNTPESVVFNLLLVVFVLVSVVFPEKGSRQSSCVLQEIP